MTSNLLSLFIVPVWLTACCSSTAGLEQSDSAVVESDSPALSDGPILGESIGIETLGGVFTPLLEQGCIVPCKKTEIYSTAVDHQDQITVSFFRGGPGLVRDAVSLGDFEISGFESAPRGIPQVQAEIAAQDGDITISVQERLTGAPLRVVRSP